MRVQLAALFVVLLVGLSVFDLLGKPKSTSQAQVQLDDSPIRHVPVVVSTDRFRIATQDFAWLARSVAPEVAELPRIVSSLLGVEWPRRSERMTTFLLLGAEDYRTVARRLAPLSTGNQGFFTISDTGSEEIAASYPDRISVIHEGVHAALAQADVDIPIWLNEGLAMYIAGQSLLAINEGHRNPLNMRPLDKQSERWIAELDYTPAYIRITRRRRVRMPLHDLCDLTFEKFLSGDVRSVIANYGMSYGLIQYLYAGDGGAWKYVLKRVAACVLKGGAVPSPLEMVDKDQRKRFEDGYCRFPSFGLSG